MLMALDDDGREPHALELGRLECCLIRCCGESALVMAGVARFPREGRIGESFEASGLLLSISRLPATARRRGLGARLRARRRDRTRSTTRSGSAPTTRSSRTVRWTRYSAAAYGARTKKVPKDERA